MIKTRTVLCSVILAAGAVAAVRPFAPQEMPQPVEQHKLLLQGVGEWEGTITMDSMGGMSSPATDSVSAVGGFWTTSVFKSDFNGMAFQGASTAGYDSKKGAYVGTWIDSMTSHLTLMTGHFDGDKNALVMEWEGPNMMGEMTPHRSETVYRADAYVSKFYEGKDAGTLSMTIAMKRKSAAIDANADKDADADDGGQQSDADKR